MNVRWFTTRAAFLLLALAIYPSKVPPQQIASDASQSTSHLRFAQSIALSDFDRDGLIDEAKLNAFGAHKSVGIFLSGTLKQSLIFFESRGAGHGSLFSRDVDNDGAPDLIWTDLIHADNVIVWLGDGSGEFERLASFQYGAAFTLGDENIAPPSDSNQEIAINFESNSPLDYTPIQKFADRSATAAPNQHSNRIGSASPTVYQPTDRGPPPDLA
jgi:hypothetical protein